MAVSTNSYFSNSIQATMLVGSDIDIYAIDSTPKFALGTGFMRGDGNKYRYVHAGALIARGQVVSADTFESSTPSNSPVIFGAARVSPTLVKPSGYNIDPNAVGSSYLQILLTATADQFAGAYINMVSGSGSGYSYRIKGNVATGTPSTGYTYVELYDELQGPIDTTTVFSVSGCKWANCKPAIGITTFVGSSSNLTGVAVTGITNNAYGWVCTKGYTHALQGIPTASYSSLAMLSTNTAGAVARWSLNTEPDLRIQAVGVYVMPASSTAYSVIDVDLE